MRPMFGLMKVILMTRSAGVSPSLAGRLARRCSWPPASRPGETPGRRGRDARTPWNRSSYAEPPALFLVDLAPGDDVCDDRQSDGRRAEESSADGSPSIKAAPRFEDAVRQLVGAHAARLEHGIAVAVLWIEPPLRRQQSALAEKSRIKRRARHRRQRIEVRNLQARLERELQRALDGLGRVGVISEDERAVDGDAALVQRADDARVRAADGVPRFVHLRQALGTERLE